MCAAFRPCHPLSQRDGNSLELFSAGAQPGAIKPGRPCKISSENGDAINQDKGWCYFFGRALAKLFKS